MSADPFDRTATLSPRDLPTAPSESAPVASEQAPLPVDDPERYQVIGEHARGGLGRIVRAIDKRLGRTVAVKELLRHDAGHEARFMREALITARLEHPGIVSVHEAGRWPNGEPYYVMKLVEGRTLKALITERASVRERLELLPHIIALADAVGYAHSEGVIHRDLKPSNVLVGAFGETVVVDWGLARDCKQDLPEPLVEQVVASGEGTISGRVVGTPGYMSPEQARGDLVDERADVYAIGAVLYELLTGLPPHAARHDETPQSVIERVLAGPPDRVVGEAPHELVDIVEKAMSREPAARYANASALAEDLRRFQTGKLVSAHAYTPWQIVRKKLAQHRGVVTIAAASAVALAAVGVESFRSVVAQRDIARVAQTRAEDARSLAEQHRRELVLVQAQTALRKDPTAALAWLSSSPIADVDLANAVEISDEALALGVARHVFRTDDESHAIELTPDGRTLFVGTADGWLYGYDLASGSRRALGHARSAVDAIAVSSDGKTVVTGHALGEVMVWSPSGGEPRALVDHGTPVKRMRFEPDGQALVVEHDPSPAEIVTLDGKTETIGTRLMAHVAVAEHDSRKRVGVISTDQIVALDGATPRPIARSARPVLYLVVSPDGDTVVVHDGQKLWAVPYAGGPLQELVSYPFELWGLGWSPDGRTLVVYGWGHDVLLVDMDTRKVRELHGHTDTVFEAMFTRDGHRLLTGSDDGTARVWNLDNGHSTVLIGHDDDVFKVRFTPDARYAVTASLDRSVRVWPLDAHGARVLDEHAPVKSMKLEGDLAQVTTPTGLARWNIATGTREALFSWSAGETLPAPDGEHVARAVADFAIEIEDRGGAKRVLRGHRARITEARWSHDGKQLYTSSHDGTLRRWDPATGVGIEVVHHGAPIDGFALSDTGRLAYSAGETLFFVEPDGRVHEGLPGAGACTRRGHFEPVRQRLIIPECDRGLIMFDGDRRIELDSGTARATDFAVSPDGSLIAAGFGDRTVRVWNAEGKSLWVLRGHTDLVWSVAFSPDGKRLASSSYDKTIRIWELGSDRHRVLRGHSDSVGSIAWRNADELVSASDDGTLRMWNVPETRLPTGAELAHRIVTATTAVIDARHQATTP